MMNFVLRTLYLELGYLELGTWNFVLVHSLVRFSEMSAESSELEAQSSSTKF